MYSMKQESASLWCYTRDADFRGWRVRAIKIKYSNWPFTQNPFCAVLPLYFYVNMPKMDVFDVCVLRFFFWKLMLKLKEVQLFKTCLETFSFFHSTARIFMFSTHSMFLICIPLRWTCIVFLCKHARWTCLTVAQCTHVLHLLQHLAQIWHSSLNKFNF